MNTGWIKLHRSLLDWEWYDDVNVKVLFLHCTLKANHTEKQWRGVTIERGQFYTSLESLSKETKLTTQQLRTALKKLESTGEITSKQHAKARMITVIGYDSYQSDNKVTNKEVTRNQQGSNKEVTTTKNEKNIKNEKNDKNTIASDDAERVYQAYPRKVGKQDGLKAISKALKTTPVDQLLEHLKLYGESVKDKDKQFLPHPATYFNKGRHLEPIEIITKAEPNWTLVP
ncbi:hypothetical protein N9251_03060 [Gammaproteobacteria bacterium]|nr:hypothetical protein [Gammaproteobacteria bacterium]